MINLKKADVEVRRKKNAVGLFAITLLLLFTVLTFMDILSVIEWIIADVAVALIANLVLRSIGKQNNHT